MTKVMKEQGLEMINRVRKIELILMWVAVAVITSSVLTQKIHVIAEEIQEEQQTDRMEGHINRSEDRRWYYVSKNFIMNEVEDDGDVVIVGRTRDNSITFPYETYEENELVNGETKKVSKKKFIIPSEIDGHKVTGIGNPCQNGYYSPHIPEENDRIDEKRYAFNNFDDYDLVVVPEGVDIIFDYCFYGSGFKAVSLPDNLTYIGENAFYICEQLESMNIPPSVEKIGQRAFRETPWLDNLRATSNQHLVIFNGILVDGIDAEGNVVIPQNVRIIGPWAFYGNATGEDDVPSKITSVTIPSSVIEIGDYAFAECRSLTTVNFGNSVEKIGYLAFGRSGLKEIIIPSTVKYIDSGLCYECPDLVKAVFACNADYYGTSLFDTCTSLENVSLPDGLKKIDRLWFWGCTSLADIKIPSSVEEIGYKAFTSCKSLSRIVLPENLKAIGDSAFLVNSDSSADKLVLTVPEKMTDISSLGLFELDYVTLRVLAGSDVEKYLIDKKTPSYQTYMKGMQDIYEGTVNITNNNITNNDTTIIDNSTNINNPVININPVTNNNDNSINTTNNNTINDSIIGNMTGGDNNGSMVNGSDNADSKGNVDDEIIAGKTFTYGKSKYKVNDNEKTVTFVCMTSSKKTSLSIPKTVKFRSKKLKVTAISDNACKGMKKLKTVVIGDNVEVVGKKAFYNCPKLKTVTFGKNVEEIGKMSFYSDKNIKKITFKKIKSLKSVEKAAFFFKSGNTDKRLKNKQSSKKRMIKYLENSGIKVKS